MKVPIHVEPLTDASAPGQGPVVQYRWDTDTEILAAHVAPQPAGDGLSGSVELEGADGSWLVLDVKEGRISSVEVAVWPEVRTRPTLQPPGSVENASVRVPARGGRGRGSGAGTARAVASVEVETAMVAEADQAERVFHFTLGRPKRARTVRLANDLLLDVDGKGNLVGVWFLNVPPFPARV